MTRTSPGTQAKKPSLGDVIHRVSVPFLIFSAALFGFLYLSASLLLPKLTQVEISGKGHSALELGAKVSGLEDKVEELAGERMELITPLRGGSFGLAKLAKYKKDDFLKIIEDLDEIAQRIVPDNKDAIHLSSFSHSVSGGKLHLSGEVRGVGPGSMTVLAQFVEEVRGASWVLAIYPPAFERDYDDERGFYSPFSFTVSLK